MYSKLFELILTFESLSVTLRTARSEIQRIPHAEYIAFSVLYGYQNKQRLLPYTALTDWFL
jgi:ABC-type dipeptide/oligopeptide/nickel transport system permease subunit